MWNFQRDFYGIRHQSRVFNTLNNKIIIGP
jgi:hypothetical protein